MIYPVYVHPGDDNHAHTVIFPDFPGCFAAADTLEELPAKIQEAVDCHYGLGNEELPPPSRLEDLQKQPEFQGGAWFLASIDVAPEGS